MENSIYTYRLATGVELKLTGEGWLTANSQDAPQAKAACAVSVRNAPEGMPTFVVFIGKEVCELRRDPDLDAIDAAIAEAWPAYADVLGARVEPVLDAAGDVVNASAWAAAPEPGYFDLAAALQR